MHRYVRIKILPDGIRVRFEQVVGEFDQLRDAFYRSIPTAKWNRNERWMIVPLDDIGAVLDFCYHHFGVGSVIICQPIRAAPMPKQLQMNL